MRIRIIAFAAIVVAAVGAAASFTTPAQAQAGAGGKGRHCVMNLSAPSAPTTCYDSFTEAIAKASGGRITDAPSDVRAAMRDPKLAAELNSGGGIGTKAFVIGVEYYLQNFSGASLTFNGDHTCTGTTSDLEYRQAPLPTLGGINWNNNIRSFQGFNNCYQRMWDNANCTGLLLDYTGSSADMGVARDRTECIDWS
jgi:hypothetical protein